MDSSNFHPCRNVKIEDAMLLPRKLYTYREGSLKATILFLEDLTVSDYFRYRIKFIDGKYKDEVSIIEITKKPVGYWGMWYIYDYHPNENTKNK